MSNAGKALKTSFKFNKKLLKKGYQTKMINLLEDNDYQALVADLKAEDILVIFGGDGTLHQIVNNDVFNSLNNKIYMYRSGRGNDFARGNKGKFFEITNLVKNLPKANINGTNHYFLNGLGIGIDALTCKKQADNFLIGKKESYFKIIRQKTAMLFAAGTSIGAVSVNAEAEQCAALRTFGEALGVCFQLKDDFLDYVSDNNGLGKPAMNDVRDGKITLPLLRAMQKAPKEQSNRLVKQIMSKEIEDIDAVRTFVMQYGGLEYTKEMMQKYKSQAIEALQVFPDSDTKDALLQILDYVIERTY